MIFITFMGDTGAAFVKTIARMGSALLVLSATIYRESPPRLPNHNK